MDKIITGVIGMGLFLVFVGGLSKSIWEVPFIIIFYIVAAMAVYGLWEEIRDDRKKAKAKKEMNQ